MSTHSYTLFLSSFLALIFYTLLTDARAVQLPNPNPIPRFLANYIPVIHSRQDTPPPSTGTPTFPSEPPSCPKCAADYENINSCAQAAPIFANVSMILFNPGAFIDVIKCACTDTFQAAYPQCVDCFIRTDQESFLSASSDDLPGIVSGIRSICAIESTLLGNVSVANSEVPSGTGTGIDTETDAAAVPTGTISSAEHSRFRVSFGVGGEINLGLGLGGVIVPVSLVFGFLGCVI